MTAGSRVLGVVTAIKRCEGPQGVLLQVPRLPAAYRPVNSGFSGVWKRQGAQLFSDVGPYPVACG